MKIGFHYGAYRYVRMRWTAKRLAEVVALPGSCLTPLESDNVYCEFYSIIGLRGTYVCIGRG